MSAFFGRRQKLADRKPVSFRMLVLTWTPRHTAVIFIIVTGFIILTLRLEFVSEIVTQNSSQKIISFQADTSEYLQLASNLVYKGRYALPETESRDLALSRTPGYPLFCAFFEWGGFSPSGILLAQAFVGTLIPVGIVLLVNSILRSKLAGFVAGLASAMSPTGIGLTGMILTDLLFAAFFITGILLLYYGIAISRPWLTYSAGGVFGCALLVKPTLIFWPIISPIVWFLFGRAEQAPFARRHLMTFVLLQLVFLIGWSARNYAFEDSFTFSTIGAKTLRQYLALRVEEWAQTDRYPRGDEMVRKREILRSRDEADLATGNIRSVQIAQRQLAESFAIFRKHPSLAIREYLYNVLEALSSGWGYFQIQLPEGSILRSLLIRVGDLTNTSQKLVLILMGSAFFGLFFPHCWNNEHERRRNFGTLALLTVIAYFASLAGTTYWTGPRIMYPAEFAFIALSLIGVFRLVAVGRKLVEVCSALSAGRE